MRLWRKTPGRIHPCRGGRARELLFNSKDLCMIGHIPELVKSGITSFKIEGRVKSEYYVATVVKAYREELDRYEKRPGGLPLLTRKVFMRY